MLKLSKEVAGNFLKETELVFVASGRFLYNFQTWSPMLYIIYSSVCGWMGREEFL